MLILTTFRVTLYHRTPTTQCNTDGQSTVGPYMEHPWSPVWTKYLYTRCQVKENNSMVWIQSLLSVMCVFYVERLSDVISQQYIVIVCQMLSCWTKIHFIPSISETVSQNCYHCIPYTRCHLMSLISHCQLGFYQTLHIWACYLFLRWSALVVEFVLEPYRRPIF